MWTFFQYVAEPVPVLARLSKAADAKVIVDLNPRAHPIGDGVAAMRAAGLRDVAWRPVPIPLTRRLGPGRRALLGAALRVPPARDQVLRRRLNVVLEGGAG
jgi:hypothetical protein